jgi:hypothetical protein
LKLNSEHRLPVYADDMNILGENTHTVKKNEEALVVASNDSGPELMSDKVRHYEFPVSDAFPHVVRTLANR